MKVSYKKTWDDNGYTIHQIIKCESFGEFEEANKLFTEFTSKNKNGSYSLGLTATEKIKYHFKNNRILLNKNTILFYNN